MLTISSSGLEHTEVGAAYQKSEIRINSESGWSIASQSDHKATIIDGKAIAQTIRSEIAGEVRNLSQKYGKVCSTWIFEIIQGMIFHIAVRNAII